jgi:hypothetical protein
MTIFYATVILHFTLKCVNSVFLTNTGLETEVTHGVIGEQVWQRVWSILGRNFTDRDFGFSILEYGLSEITQQSKRIEMDAQLKIQNPKLFIEQHFFQIRPPHLP